MDQTQTQTVVETQWVAVSLIDVPEYGRVHSPGSVHELAQDMARNGQLQNIVVCKEGERYQLVVGKGRLEAARELGWEKIRADVKEGCSAVQKLTMISSENSERAEVSPFYTAMIYKMIMEAGKLTQRDLAAQVGKDQSMVCRYLALAEVPREVWQEHQSGLLSLRQCLEIAKADGLENQKKLAEACVKEGLEAPALKKLAKSLKAETTGETASTNTNGAPPADFRFTWKGNGLLIKSRPFIPHTESFGQYLQSLESAYDRFMAQEKSLPLTAA